MVMRGAAPSAACPRCGEVVPASTARLVTCAACKLSFDPAAERPVSIRRNRAQPLIERVKITRTPTSLTLRSSFERRTGAIIAVGGVGLVAAAVAYGLSAFGAFAATVGAAIALLGIAFAGPHVIRVDPDQVSAGRLLSWRRSRLPLADLDRIEVGAVYGVNETGATYYVAAVPVSGANTLLFVTKSKELADHVARVIGDALATMPPKALGAAAETAVAPGITGRPLSLPGDLRDPD